MNARTERRTMAQALVKFLLAQQVERGLYTTIGREDLGERLRIVQDDAARQAGALALPVAYDPQAEPPGFRIQAP